MEEYKIHRNIICIDLKSFFASVECVLRGVDPFTTPLVVADPKRGDYAIILAVSPYLKSKGVPSRLRVADLPKEHNAIIARPRMQEYLNYSAKVIEIYLEFISEDDLYVYSIDEAFLDVTSYLNYYQLTTEELAKKILDRITEKLGLYATAGIGPNMLLAKVALDVESKYAADFIASWTYDDVKTKLWQITPLSKMWGIGHAMERNLNILGLQTIGDVANYSLKILKNKYGILGEELYYHTHGIDMSLISEKIGVKPNRKSYGVGQVLFREYDGSEIILIIQEMVDDLTRRIRLAKKRGNTVSLGIRYSPKVGGGFSRQIKLDQPTNSDLIIFQACLDLFDQYYEHEAIKGVSISVTGLTDNTNYQYSMFEDADLLDKHHNLQLTIDKIKEQYGRNSVNRASSELEHSTAKQRNRQIGGHHE